MPNQLRFSSLPAFLRYEPLALSFAKHVTETIGSYFKKDLVSHLAEFVQPKVRVRWRPSFDFVKSSFDVVHLKETAFLCRVASVFGKANLDAVSPENYRPMRLVLS